MFLLTIFDLLLFISSTHYRAAVSLFASSFFRTRVSLPDLYICLGLVYKGTKSLALHFALAHLNSGLRELAPYTTLIFTLHFGHRTLLVIW